MAAAHAVAAAAHAVAAPARNIIDMHPQATGNKSFHCCWVHGRTGPRAHADCSKAAAYTAQDMHRPRQQEAHATATALADANGFNTSYMQRLQGIADAATTSITCR